MEKEQKGCPFDEEGTKAQPQAEQNTKALENLPGVIKAISKGWKGYTLDRIVEMANLCLQQKSRITELEAENKEFREALTQISDMPLAVTYDFEHSDKKMRQMGEIAEQALKPKQ